MTLGISIFLAIGCASTPGWQRYQAVLQRQGKTHSESDSPIVLASAQEELSDEARLPDVENLPRLESPPDPFESDEDRLDAAAESREADVLDSEVGRRDVGQRDDEPDASDEDSEDAPDTLLDTDCEENNALQLPEILSAVQDSYPLLAVALAELDGAEGKILSQWGSFDSVLSGYSISKPLGFYETYQNGVKVSRPLWNGGQVYGGYRVGRGVFEPWYLERQTNEGGEFKTGIKQPFLAGYAIDERRAALQIAELERLRLEPDIQSRVIGMRLAASALYWKWVAAGQVVRTQARLVELAERRNENLVKQVEAEDLPKITEIDNGRFIAKRQAKLVESRRKVQEAAIKMSLFFRDADGQPVVVDPSRLPCEFPTADPIDAAVVEADIASALAQRPELLELQFQRRQVEVELCYATNKTLPKLDGYAEAGQDVGEPTSSKRDKSELEIEVGLLAEVPLQRRAAIGKMQAARAKLAQIDAKRVFVEDKIRSQVQDAVSAMSFAYQRIEQAQENLELTRQSLRLGLLRFEEGDIDLIALNIYETSLAEAEFLVIDAEMTYFMAVAEYQAALGVPAF